jgi:outer membrane protein TolC
MKRAIFLTCIFALVGAWLSAETIDLEKARVLALANSRRLAQLNLNLRSSELDEKSQLYSMLPSLSANYSASMSYLDSNWGFVNPIDTLSARATVSVTQTIFEGGKSFIRKAIGEIATESVRNDALAEYFSVLDSVDNAYYSALEAAASLEAAESSLQSANLSLSIAEIRLANGMLNQGDYLRALADKESRESSRNQARRTLALNLSKLDTLIGLSQAPELEQIDFSAYEGLIQYLAGISDEEIGALYSRLWDAITRANLTLVGAALSKQRAEYSYTLSKRDYVPTISASVFSTGLNWSTANGFSTTSSGGISITGRIPLDFWVLSNNLEKSKIAYDSALMTYAGAEISLEGDLYSSLISTIAQAESFLSSRRTLDYVERNSEYVMERYRLSQASVLEYVDASSLLLTNRNNYIRSSYGFLQSLSKLRSLTAIDDEERLIRLLMGN